MTNRDTKETSDSGWTTGEDCRRRVAAHSVDSTLLRSMTEPLFQCQHLIKRRQGIAHAAVPLASDQGQGRVADGDPLPSGDIPQTGNDLGQGNPFEVETLTARENGDRQLVGLGGGKDELDVGRRLFQSLQQGVESIVGEHVDFVDDKDLVTAVRGKIPEVVAQFADVVHTGVGGAVNLEDIG